MIYRATPHLSTGVSPAELFFGRRIKTKLPHVNVKPPSSILDTACERDRDHKQRTKEYADKVQHAQPSVISEGDSVLLRQQKSNKLSSAYDPLPYRVVKKKGPSVILQRGNGPRIMRNVSFVKKVPFSSKREESAQEKSIPRTNKQHQAKATGRRPSRTQVLPGHFRDFVVGWNIFLNRTLEKQKL